MVGMDMDMTGSVSSFDDCLRLRRDSFNLPNFLYAGARATTTKPLSRIVDPWPSKNPNSILPSDFWQL